MDSALKQRTDIKKILLIGSGPIQIGQACEFDYSGTQAVRALKELGYEVVLVNSNPATIMTDPGMADRTYIEPLCFEILEKIIATEKPDAILPTLGGQVALNLTMELFEHGVLETYGVEVLGARTDSIEIAEDRDRFRDLLLRLELPVLNSKVIRSEAEGFEAAKSIGFPLILRPSYTLGGTGGGVVFNREELAEKLQEALRASPTSEVLLEESIAGWKEIEYEIMCDRKGQMVVVCTIENLDPMGVHTGDSITVAPMQTLTDKEVQRLREASKKIADGVGIETGGCNIQYALDPNSDRWVVVEMNPRVSRSSALASKATGFPIAKIAAKLAVGFCLDEIKNDITRVTPSCFEPAIDYVVIKIPRFTFEKFQKTEPILGTQMKSVGEVMSFGRSFKEALMKAFSSLEQGHNALLLPQRYTPGDVSPDMIRSTRYDRWWLIAELLRSKKLTVDEVHDITQIDQWFLGQLDEIIQLENYIRSVGFSGLTEDLMREAKTCGFSDVVLAKILNLKEDRITQKRLKLGVESQLNQVDTCAGEFEAATPYYYFAYENFPAEQEQDIIEFDDEDQKEAVIILGSGPNRIGQGVEFDYCCVKAVQAAKAMGYEAIMLNCNPETVSTDYDISDRLYFEPMELEYVDRVIREELKTRKIKGVICQTGGQTSLGLSQEIKLAPILGTSSDQVDRAEDRGKFERLLQKLNLKRPQSKSVSTEAGLRRAMKTLGFPLLIRPSYVLGGRSMHIVRSEPQLETILDEMKLQSDFKWPLLVDRFLEDAVEIDVECIGDGKEVMVIAVMEHTEEAGIHSGDSSCSLPAVTLSDQQISKIKVLSEKICKELKLCGFLNLQLAIYKSEFYVLEVNPRASRTLPFVCKSTGNDWVNVGTQAMLGRSFKEQAVKAPPLTRREMPFVSVKQVVFPFLKFPGVDVLLGPEMKSTGEVMSLGYDFNEAFAKGLLASNHRLPKSGCAFISVKDADKPKVVDIAKTLKKLGFRIIATHSTAKFLQNHSIVAARVNKVKEGQPHIVDAIINGQVQLVVNTTESESAIADSFSIRRSALQTGVPYFTTLTAARAAVNSLDRWIRGDLPIIALQDLKKLSAKKRPSASSGKQKSSKSLQKKAVQG